LRTKSWPIATKKRWQGHKEARGERERERERERGERREREQREGV